VIPPGLPDECKKIRASLFHEAAQILDFNDFNDAFVDLSLGAQMSAQSGYGFR
jgi:hypothetical protein